MTYLAQYLQLQTALWQDFEQLVRRGARFPALVDVFYRHGVVPAGLPLTTEGQAWFDAQELLADPDYVLLEGVDLVVGAGYVTFVDSDGKRHYMEPDIDDLYWLAQLLDSAVT